MDRSPILFRCDGNPDTGWESVYQSLVYAQALQRRRRPCFFLGQFQPFQLITQINRGGNEYLVSDHPVGSAEDCDATIQAIRKVNAAAVIIAAPGLSMEYLREVASTGALIAVLDSEAKVCFPTRMVINPLLGPERGSYVWERGTQLLLGARYALVRSPFRRQRAIRVGEPQGAFRILLAFGDDDCTGQSLQRAEELLAASRVDKITAFVRCHHPQIEDLKKLANRSENRLEIVTEVADLTSRLARIHFAVTSGDGTALEIACVGIPQLILTQHQRHQVNASIMDQEGVALCLGHASQVTPLQFREAVSNLYDDPLERIGMARCARQLIDGRGPDRLVSGLEVMLRPARYAVEERMVA